MAEFNIRQSAEEWTLIVRGSLTIEYASGFKAVLLELAKGARRSVLNFEEVTEVDLSFLQLLYAYWSEASARGRVVSLTGSCIGVLKGAAKSAGYSRECVGVLDGDKSFLWAGNG